MKIIHYIISIHYFYFRYNYLKYYIFLYLSLLKYQQSFEIKANILYELIGKFKSKNDKNYFFLFYFIKNKL
jgi:hypothetical protein